MKPFLTIQKLVVLSIIMAVVGGMGVGLQQAGTKLHPVLENLVAACFLLWLPLLIIAGTRKFVDRQHKITEIKQITGQRRFTATHVFALNMFLWSLIYLIDKYFTMTPQVFAVWGILVIISFCTLILWLVWVVKNQKKTPNN